MLMDVPAKRDIVLGRRVTAGVLAPNALRATGFETSAV